MEGYDVYFEVCRTEFRRWKSLLRLIGVLRECIGGGTALVGMW